MNHRTGVLGPHRHHATIETAFADLIDGPGAHQPSVSLPGQRAWTMLAGIAHNLFRAARHPHRHRARRRPDLPDVPDYSESFPEQTLQLITAAEAHGHPPG